MRRLRLASAFTLIELLVVILILGILIAVAAPSFLGQTEKAHDSAAKQSLTVAYKAARAAAVEGEPQGAYDLGAPGNVAEDMRSALAQSEPQYTVTVGTTSSGPNNIAVDPSSSASTLYLWVRSGSGKVFHLTAPANGGPTISGDVFSTTQGPGESTVNLTVTGGVITDAVRTANTSGDGRSSDSSFGIWGATANQLHNGGFETNAAGWSTFGSSVTASRSTAQAKFGSASLEVVTPGLVGSEGVRATSGSGLASPAGNVWIGSFWIRPTTAFTMAARLIVHHTDATSEPGSYGFLALTPNVWQRLVIPSVAIGAGKTGDSITVEIEPQNTVAAMFFFDGVQIEQQPLATPYVETNGATATRAAALVQAPASLINVTQGWVAMRVRMGWSSASPPSFAPRLFSWSNDSPFDNRIEMLLATNQIRVMRFSGGAGTEFGPTISFVSGDTLTYIFRWTASALGVSVNGNLFTSQAGTSIPSSPRDTFAVGNFGGGSFHSPVLSDILWFACGTGTLTNTDAASFSAYPEPPILSQMPGNATMRWLATDAKAFVRAG